MHRVLAALAPLLLVAGAGPSEGRTRPAIDGEYDSPLGRIRIRGDGTSYRGTLVAPAPPCRFEAGEEVLRGTLLDDSLAGQLHVCLSGARCEAEVEWASTVLLVAPGRLAGAVHVGAKGCEGPLGRKGGITLARVSADQTKKGAARSGRTDTTATATSTSTSDPVPSDPEDPKARRERARTILRDGAVHLSEGSFEQARKRFLEAIDVDSAVPEAYNGVGVTYRMRNDLAGALSWYKKALAVDPDFGDAYYNMACVYALQGRKQLALRYLQIAALNGYATADGIGADPDLELLRNEPAYHALVKARM
jgi:hypothetical protein